MRYGVGAPDVAHASVVNHLHCIPGKQRVCDGDVDCFGSSLQQQSRSLRQGMTAAGDVIEQHDMSSVHRYIGQFDFHVCVAMPCFAAYAVVKAVLQRCCADPLFGFLVWTNEQGAFALAVHKVSQ